MTLNPSHTKRKIYFIFIGIAALFLAFALVLLNQSMTIKNFSTEIEINWMPNIVAMNAINTATSDYRAAEVLHVMSTDAAEMDEYEQTLQQLGDDIIALQSKYEPLIASDKERTLYQKFAKSYDSYVLASKQTIGLSQNNDPEKAALQLKRSGSLFNVLSNDLLKLLELNNEGSVSLAQQGNKAFEWAKIVIAIGCLIIVAVLFFFALLLHGGGKVSLAFSLIAVFFIAFSGLFYQQLVLVNEQINQLNTHLLPRIIAVNALNTKTSDYRIAEALHVLSTPADEMTQWDEELNSMSDDIARYQKKYVSMMSSDYEHDLYTAFSTAYSEYITASQHALGFSRTNEKQKAGIQLKQSGVLFRNFNDTLRELVAFNQRGGIDSSHSIDATLQSLKITTIGAAVFILFLIMIVAELVQSWLFDEPLDSAIANNGLMTLTIKMKLWLACLGMIGNFIFFGWLMSSLMQTMNAQTHKLEMNGLPSIAVINEINALTGDYRIAEAQHILITRETDRLLWDKTLKRLTHKISQAQARYESLISSEEERGIYQNFSNKYKEYLKKSEQMLALARKNNTAAAAQELQYNRILFDAFGVDLKKLVDLRNVGGIETAQLAQRIFDEAQYIIWAIIWANFMDAILFMLIFNKNISLALQRLTKSIKGLADGLTNPNSNSDGQGDEIDQLTQGLTVVSQALQTLTHDDFQHRSDEIGQLTKGVAVVTQTLQTVFSDSIELIETTRAGILSTHSTALNQETSLILICMNSLIALLSKPLTEVAQIMQNLALGDLSGRMQGNYEGELRILKTNVNRSLDSLDSLLTELITTMQLMAQANLTHTLTGNYQGDFSVLKANTNQTIVQMNELLQEITSHASNSAAAITQTSEASKYVAKEATLQMAAVAKIVWTIEDATRSVAEIADKASKTTANAENKNGEQQLNKLIELIRHVDSEFSKIEQITAQITRIADKTHLLSLNAGLEAMRAGEHGRGFGFVAQQIGTLAEEASTSARDIGIVISSSAQSVRLGVRDIEQIAQAAKLNEQTLQVLLTAIKSLTENTQDIEESSKATASAAEEISATMAHLAETVRQTAQQAKRFTLAEPT